MKKIPIKRLIASLSLIVGLTGTVNVMADTVNPEDVQPYYEQYGPRIPAIKSYTYDKYATSSTQYNKRDYTYVNIPPSSRQTDRTKYRGRVSCKAT